MADYDVSSLIDDSANPLKANGIDPSEAVKNPQQVMAYLQNMKYGGGMAKPSSIDTPTPSPSYTPKPSQVPMASATVSPTQSSNSWGLQAMMGTPAAAPTTAAPGGAGANVSNGDSDPDLDRARTLAEKAQAAGDKNQQQWDQLTDQQKAAEAQRIKDAQLIDKRGTSATTGESYVPSTGRKILRGLQGAAAGLMRGGIRGAALGAIDPRLEKVPGYTDPTAQYGRDVAAQQSRVGSDDQQLSNLKEQVKAQYDAGRNLSTDTAANAKTFADIAAQRRAGDQAKAEADRAAATQARQDEQTRHNNASESVAQQRADIADRNATSQAARTDALIAKMAGANAGQPEARKAVIDSAQSELKNHEDNYTYVPATPGADGKPGKPAYYESISNPLNVLTPDQYTDKGQRIIDRVNKQLTAKKMTPIQYKFNKDNDTDAAPANPQPGGGAPAAAAPATKNNAKPKSGTVVGPAGPGAREGRTGQLKDGTPVIVKGGNLVVQ